MPSTSARVVPRAIQPRPAEKIGLCAVVRLTASWQTLYPDFYTLRDKSAQNSLINQGKWAFSVCTLVFTVSAKRILFFHLRDQLTDVLCMTVFHREVNPYRLTNLLKHIVVVIKHI